MGVISAVRPACSTAERSYRGKPKSAGKSGLIGVRVSIRYVVGVGLGERGVMQTITPPTPPDPPQMFHHLHRRGGNGWVARLTMP